MKPIAKLGVVVLGYVVALGIALLAFAARQLATSGPEAQAASGMYAAGDMFLFLGVFCFTALVPTALALYWLRSSRRFWLGLGGLAVVVAATGVVAMVLFVSGRHAVAPAPIAIWAGFSVLRILATVILTPAFLLASFLAPDRTPRIMLFAAGAAEAAVGGAFLVLMRLGP